MNHLKTILSIIIILIQSCDTTEPKIEENIVIQEVDVAVTEAYLHVSFESEKERKLVLFRDGESINGFTCSSKDTIITDTALTLNTNYKYKIKEYKDNSVVSESNTINLTTLEPTSHNIIWETYYFEEQISGTFWDVAIIDENNIWAVGEVYLPDSLGERERWPNAAAHWDGNDWQLSKVEYRRFGTNNILPGDLKTVFIDEELNIYTASPAVLLVYDVDKWKEKAFLIKEIPFEGQVRKIWARNIDNIYCSGNNGAIYHVTNSGWKQIESNAEYAIFDLWGYNNPINQQTEIICAASDYYEVNKSDLLKIDETNNVHSLNLETNSFTVSAWTLKGYPSYVCGDGIFSNKTGKWKKVIIGTNYSLHDIRGTGPNDIFVVGDYGLLAHYNGIDWKIYDFQFDGGFTSLSVKENIIAISGNKDGKAIVTIGKRT